MAERQHTDWDGLGADWLVGCLTGRLGYDTAGAAADSPRFPSPSPPPPPEPGPGFARQPNLNVCFKRGTSSLFFVKREDREKGKATFLCY